MNKNSGNDELKCILKMCEVENSMKGQCTKRKNKEGF